MGHSRREREAKDNCAVQSGLQGMDNLSTEASTNSTSIKLVMLAAAQHHVCGTQQLKDDNSGMNDQLT